MVKISSFFPRNRELSRKIADQLVAASNSYLILIVPLLQGNFRLLGELSTLVGLYVFWLGVIRIYLINEIIRLGESGNTFRHYSVRGFKAGITSVPILLCGGIFHTSKWTLIIVVVLIFAGIQEEILRQYFISHLESIKALLVDAVWSVGMIIGICSVRVRSPGVIEEYLLIISSSCVIATIFGLVLVNKSNFLKSTRTSIKPISPVAAVIPISMALHTFLLNMTLTIFHHQLELGLLRALQFFFLPAIFLINVQANYFKFPSGRDQQSEKNSETPHFRLIFLLSVLASFIISCVYLVDSGTLSLGNLSLGILVSCSVLINFSINLKTLSKLHANIVRQIVILRLIWISLAAVLMILLSSKFLLLIFLLFVLDLVLNSCLGRVRRFKVYAARND